MIVLYAVHSHIKLQLTRRTLSFATQGIPRGRFSHTVPEPADTVPVRRRVRYPRVTGTVFYETRGTYSTRGYYSLKCIKKQL